MLQHEVDVGPVRSFLHDGSEPYTLGPTYDMLPMAPAPQTSGEIPEVKPAGITFGRAKSEWHAST